MITDIDGDEYDVIDDPDLVAHLRLMDARHAGTPAMTRYAIDHGARPTGWSDGDPIPVVEALWNPDGPDIYIWATDDDEAADEDEYGDDDPWVGLTD